MTPAEAFDALYLELLPIRPTPPDPHRMRSGPTAAWAELQARRELWALAGEDEERAEDVA